jgi:hypothetical protein
MASLRQKSFRWLGAGAGLYLALCVLAGSFLIEGALRPGRRLLTPQSIETAGRLASQTGVALQPVEIAADDATPLRAWLFEAPSARRVVILAHGVSDNRSGMLKFAELFLKEGYSALLPDARAHGQSGGNLASYGVREAADLRSWARWARHKYGCVYGLGESMGAAILLQSLDGSEFCAVVAESPFVTFREIAYDRLGQPLRAGTWFGSTFLRPVVESAFFYARMRYGIDLRQASAEGAVRRTAIPILLIHGATDESIPLRHSRRLRQANPSASLWEIPECPHTGAVSAHPREFEKRVLGWFRESRCE